MFKYLIFVLIQVLISTNYVKLELEPSQVLCFKEDIPMHVLIYIRTESEEANFSTELFYGPQRLINCYNKLCDKHITTQGFGVYRLCVYNPQPTNLKIKFKFSIGADARDFDSRNHTDSIKDLNNIVQIAEGFVEEIKNDNSIALPKILSESQSPVKHLYPFFFSGIFIIGTLVLSYVQYKLVKRVFQTRKYI